MKLKKFDSQQRRIIALFSEEPPAERLWDLKKKLFDLDRVHKWKLGIDLALSVEEIYELTMGPLPGNYL